MYICICLFEYDYFILFSIILFCFVLLFIYLFICLVKDPPRSTTPDSPPPRVPHIHKQSSHADPIVDVVTIHPSPGRDQTPDPVVEASSGPGDAELTSPHVVSPRLQGFTTPVPLPASELPTLDQSVQETAHGLTTAGSQSIPEASTGQMRIVRPSRPAGPLLSPFRPIEQTRRQHDTWADYRYFLETSE